MNLYFTKYLKKFEPKNQAFRFIKEMEGFFMP
jgi:hypothetical protein